MIESLPLLKDKIHHKQVLKTLQGIIEQTKKKSDTKSVCLELEEKIKELLEGSENTETNDNILMPPPTMLKKKSRMGRQKDSDEEENSDTDLDPQPIARRNCTRRNYILTIFVLKDSI